MRRRSTAYNSAPPRAAAACERNSSRAPSQCRPLNCESVYVADRRPHVVEDGEPALAHRGRNGHVNADYQRREVFPPRAAGIRQHSNNEAQKRSAQSEGSGGRGRSWSLIGVRRRTSKIISQHDAHGSRPAVARRRANVQPPHGLNHRLVEAEARPSNNLDATHGALLINLRRRVNRRLRLGARRRLRVRGAQTPVRQRVAKTFGGGAAFFGCVFKWMCFIRARSLASAEVRPVRRGPSRRAPARPGSANLKAETSPPRRALRLQSSASPTSRVFRCAR